MELAREIEKRPGRYSGFAHLALQSRPSRAMNSRSVAASSAFSAHRSTATLWRVSGWLQFRPLLERAEEIGVPLLPPSGGPPHEYPGFVSQSYAFVGLEATGVPRKVPNVRLPGLTGFQALRSVASGLVPSVSASWQQLPGA